MKLATIKKVAPKPRFASPRPHVDLDNLQAVIAHRYDVMAKFAKSFRLAYRDEVARLKKHDGSEAASDDLARVTTARRWLHKDVSTLSAAHRVKVEGALAESPMLAKVHQMRIELAAIWERSSAPRAQLLVHRQDWCTRAEERGVHALQEFSLRLRSYA